MDNEHFLLAKQTSVKVFLLSSSLLDLLLCKSKHYSNICSLHSQALSNTRLNSNVVVLTLLQTTEILLVSGGE